MARETKVGLLAGLAFIVCFAIILANRGRRDSFVRPAVRSSTQLADARSSSTAVSSIRSARTRNSRRPLVEADTPRVSGAATTQNKPTLAPGDSGSAVSLPPDSGVRSLAESGDSPEQPTRDDMIPSNRIDITSQVNSGVAQSAASNELSSDTRQQEALTALLNDLSGAQRSGNASNPAGLPGKLPATKRLIQTPTRTTRLDTTPSVQNAARRQTAPAKRYKIASGDTLSKIAARFYGSSSRRTINAIVDANRSVLSNPDVLRIGVELRLPDLKIAPTKNRVAQGASGKAKTSNSAIKTNGATNSRDIRWYQIRKNDRYVTIAREQLGDANRWHEIYEMNRDKFPDAGRIREGVRIKLPINTATSRTERGS